MSSEAAYQGRCCMNRIGDYALIGDCHSAALIGRDGAIEWELALDPPLAADR